MKTLILPVVMALTLTACQTVKTLKATGGSRADGVVELSYEYGAFEQPVINWDDALATASERCRAWGYSSAERFGGAKSVCQGGDCMRQLVTVPYQCIGAK